MFGLLLGGEVGNKVARFAAAAVLARALSPEEFGRFNVGIALAGIVVSATALGLPEVAGRAIAAGSEDPAVAFGRALALRMLAASGAAVVFVAASFIAGQDDVGTVIAIAGMALAMSMTADWVARARTHVAALGAATVLGAITALLGSLILLVAGGTAAAALAIFAVAEGVAAAGTWLAARVRPRLSTTGGRTLLRRSWPVAVSSFVIYSYYANVDTLIIAATRGEAEAGLYSGPYRLFLAVSALAIFGAYATFPALSRADARPGADGGAQEALQRLVTVLTGVATLMLGVTVVVGGEILDIVFGAAFEDMELTLQLLMIASAWNMVGYPLGYSLLAQGRNRRFMAGAGVAGVASLGLDIALIPSMGAEGAGLATAIAFALAAAVWVQAYGSGAPGVRRSCALVAAATALTAYAQEQPAAQWPVGASLALLGALAVLPETLRYGRGIVGSRAISHRE